MRVAFGSNFPSIPKPTPLRFQGQDDDALTPHPESIPPGVSISSGLSGDQLDLKAFLAAMSELIPGAAGEIQDIAITTAQGLDGQPVDWDKARAALALNGHVRTQLILAGLDEPMTEEQVAEKLDVPVDRIWELTNLDITEIGLEHPHATDRLDVIRSRWDRPDYTELKFGIPGDWADMMAKQPGLFGKKLVMFTVTPPDGSIFVA